MREYAHMYEHLRILSAGVFLCVSQIGTGFKDEDLEQHYNFLKVKNPLGLKFSPPPCGSVYVPLHSASGPYFKLKHQFQTSSLFGIAFHLTNELQIVLDCRHLLF